MIQGETIVAIATAIAPQQGSVGIVRLSGTKSLAIAKSLFYAPGKQEWSSHRIIYGYIRDPETKQTVDEALLLLMMQPRSFTREDVAEFHCHGGIMAVQSVLQLCVAQGARLAQPGEFSLRAFLNGRIDLTQAESIAELVSAQSHQASQIAVAGLQGKLGSPIKDLRTICLDILAEIEARIDFADDLPPLDEAEIEQQLEAVLTQVKEILATAEQGELLRRGLKVAIVGRPNVGKSSLLNAWSRTDRAIVTDLPGTTRDVIESTLVVEGIPVQVLDTAGIRETGDMVEKIGVERSRRAAENADLVLLAIDGSSGWTDGDREIYEQVKHKPLILIVNKIDLTQPKSITKSAIKRVVYTSATNGQGISDLERQIVSLANQGKVMMANSEVAVNQRQAAALVRARVALEQVQQTVKNQLPLDFRTIDLRGAIQALGEITGEEVTESVLDRIFSRFCIGK
ncbi:MAG: tRNA uridine-5-carboxymethylaminomethyl(34) synthesis GTPase MnmE [Cyanobacteria bacterium J06555_3]